ncbi:MAG: beta-galactosidase, partial [Treponema sp.]|nr:beta-galactosidase [Treponema sp.]
MYTFDNKSLLKDGIRCFPVMGEIHYSRYPKEFWKESLCKMKAGGVTIVSTYVIWIHHEEIENQYDFTGDRDLHAFVQACQDCKIKLLLRIGPWIHGEVRNGGFPDWLIHKDFQVRTNDEKYFAAVEKWYKKIYQEVADFFNSPDNPIVGIQIENEFGH